MIVTRYCRIWVAAVLLLATVDAGYGAKYPPRGGITGAARIKMEPLLKLIYRINGN